MNIIRRFLHKYIYQDWNIAVCDIADDFTPINVKWMKHRYRDRWFADPFIIEEDKEHFIILAEECLLEEGKGRIARLTVTKDECELIKNETMLDLPTHLSFPIPLQVNGQMFIYPENAAASSTCYYSYSKNGMEYRGNLSDLGLADPVIVIHGTAFYLLATIGKECNGNHLRIYRSNEPLSGYEECGEQYFHDNIARRAGNVFQHNGMLISPAQVCNHEYGEGVSLQQLTIDDNGVHLKELKRIYPFSRQYPEGFHTYNVFGDKVVIDGYRYGSPILHKLYFSVRKPK